MLNNILINKRWSKIIPILVFFFGIWYFCLRILGTGLEFIPGDFGDSRFINFLLEHGHQWMHGNAGEFWNANFMHPSPNVIAISDNMLGTMPIYSFWRSMGFSFETSYQLWWMVICSLNFWSAYYVVKRWFSRWDLAILVAWVFAFTIFNLGQLNYMQMIIRFMVPITFYVATKMVETSKVKYLIIFSLAIVYQFYCVIYTGFFLMYFSLGFIFIYALLSKKMLFFIPLFKGRQLLYSSITILFSIAAMLWLILPYLDMAEQISYHTYDEVINNLPTIESYLYPQESSSVWRILNKTFEPNTEFVWIHYTFPGMIPLLGVFCTPFLFAYWKWKKTQVSKLTWAMFICIFVIFLFFIRTDSGLSLYTVVFKLPGINSIRVMNRFWHVALFIVLIALISSIKKMPPKFSIILFILIFIDNSFNPSYIVKELKTETSNRRLKAINMVKENISEEHIAFVFTDINETQYSHETQIDGMLAAQHLTIPTINGYSSSCPGKFGFFFGDLNLYGLNIWFEANKMDSSKVLIIDKGDF